MPLRLFLAIPIPAGVRQVLDDVMRQMRLSVRPRVRWAPPESIHMTLHFLGHLEEGSVGAVHAAVAPVAARYRPTEARLTEVGFFPDAVHPRVVWIGVAEPHGTAIASLREDVGKELERLRIDVDHRPWAPHLTVARLEAPVPAAAFAAHVPETRFLIDRLGLYRSDIGRGGARYTELHGYPLGV